MRRNFYQKIIEKYPTKYTAIRIFNHRFLDPVFVIAVVITLAACFLKFLAGWNILAEVCIGIYLVFDMVIMALDNKERKKGDPRGQYWNYVDNSLNENSPER
ncbi:hypothetical protein [Xylocopilactobacillus apis]|uniref:Uncharacterized protein n=1 Tax=Xylocopilactobacillus apis TaxID=2932183 RepID=A0AAU9CXC2_9LACO|nr:hypothetical protein [Xylocopilactobacillus apis]BDR57051.1 hypothetical protein KIMC2_16130 [Xylocopilactobacillus apis]